MAGRFIRGIILYFFLPPSASNTGKRIDLLLVKLTATYNQEIKRNDRCPLRQSLRERERERERAPVVTSISFIYIYTYIYTYLALASPPIPGSNKRYFGKRTPRRVALRRIKMSSKNLPYHVDPFQLRAIRARKDL